MFERKRNALILAVVAAGLLGAMAVSTALAAGKETVAYRLKKWKTLEFADQKKAKTHYDTVRRLGCEAKQAQHGSHVDVTYRCPEWKQITLDSHSAAHKWVRWLKASGFETKHQH